MKYLISGGGTGGHIYPAVAIAKEILKNENDADILFVGTKNGLENDLIPREGFKLETITVQGFKRKISIDNLKTLKKAFIGLKDANKILKNFKPDIVIGTGGYVCGPVVMMAAIKGIPTLIHEQNAFPGMTNKILSRVVKIVAVSYEESIKYFKNKKKVVVTGNPIREEIFKTNREEALKNLGFSDKIPLIVSVGGSRGAEKINDTMINLLKDKSIKFQLLIITGNKQYDNFIKTLEKEKIILSNSTKIIAYCHNMADVYAAADIIICRAGAITLAEITAKGVASILIPSPNVTNNHQEYNARVLEKGKAAYVILEKDLNAEILKDKINYILENPQTLIDMKKNSLKLARFNAANDIYKLIKSIT